MFGSLEHGQTGRADVVIRHNRFRSDFFRPADPQDLADKVRKVLSRPDLDEQRHTGRDYVVSRYSWKESIAGYLRLIDARNCKEDRCPFPNVYP